MNEERVRLVLKSLAECDGAREAPPHLEARLRREFREHRAKHARHRRTIFWTSAAAGIAAALAMGYMATIAPRPKSPSQTRYVPPIVTEQSPVAASASPTPASAKASASSTKDAGLVGHTPPPARIARVPIAAPAIIRPAPAASPARPARDQETVTDFFPLLDPAPPFERGEILRVNLPASVMRTVGLPVREERLGDRVQADILIGEEGLPRAIRFVRTENMR